MEEPPNEENGAVTGVPAEENTDEPEGEHHSVPVRPGLGPRRGGRRVITGLAQNWSSPHTELAMVQKKYGKTSWQAKALRLIHSERFQHILMGALLLDVLILFVEIFLDAQYPPCHIIERDAVSCCPVSVGAQQEGEVRNLLMRLLATEEHGVCEYPLEEIGEAGCDNHNHHAVHVVHTVLFWATISILSVFMLELIVLMIVLGFHHFTRHHLYVLDLIIVGLSLILEITFELIDEDNIASLVGLLIIGRIWRFVRIGHGLFATTLEVSLHKVEELETQVAELRYLLEESSGARVDTSKSNKRHG